MGSIKFTGNLLMAGLFAFAIISFAMYFANENDVVIDINDDSSLTGIRSDLDANMTQFQSDANTVKDAFVESQAESGDQVSTSGSQFKVGLGTVRVLATSSAKAGFNKIFGSNSEFQVFFTALAGFLALVGVMYAYKTWFGRNPD